MLIAPITKSCEVGVGSAMGGFVCERYAYALGYLWFGRAIVALHDG